MSQQLQTFLFIGFIFALALGTTTYLTAIKVLDPDTFKVVVVAVVTGTAGLLAPSPISVGKPPA